MESFTRQHRAHLRAAIALVKRKGRYRPDCDPGGSGQRKRELYSIVKAMMLLPRLESI
jgi:hypothetical protein